MEKADGGLQSFKKGLLKSTYLQTIHQHACFDLGTGTVNNSCNYLLVTALNGHAQRIFGAMD